MDTRSHQLVLDVWLDQPLTDEVIDSVLGIIRSNTTVLKRYDYRYSRYSWMGQTIVWILSVLGIISSTGMGQTIVLILSESHFVFHSYPENNYFLIDLYVCDVNTDLEGIASQILASLQAKDLQVKDQKVAIHERGVPEALTAED